MSRSMIGVVAIAMATAVAATGCGATSAGSTPVAVRSTRSGTAATRTSHKTTARVRPKNALTATVQLNGGQITLSPPPPGTVVTMTAQEAMTAFQHSDAYFPGLDQLPDSGMQFAMLTDSTFGPQPSAGQAFTPTYTNHPAWYIEYQDVPFEPSGPPPRTTTSTTVATAAPTTDLFVVLDDLTGEVIMSLLGSPGPAGTSSTTDVASPAKRGAGG